MHDVIILSIGYVAAIFLAISLFINQSLRFRWMNVCGNTSFIVYGILLSAFPIILTNTILLVINAYKIYKIHRLKEVFEFMEFKKGNDFVLRFLKFYQNDIMSYFPTFVFDYDEGKICFLVLRDLVIANIFIAKINPDGSITVEINYTVPKYRDYKVGKFIFEKRKHFLKSKGINKIVYDSVYSPQHEQFLKRVGFLGSTINGIKTYSKEL